LISAELACHQPALHIMLVFWSSHWWWCAALVVVVVLVSFIHMSEQLPCPKLQAGSIMRS
jgi:uncharacterized protein involved in exopolysaccharide biosynthesis